MSFQKFLKMRLRLLELLLRPLAGSRRVRSGLFACAACAMMVVTITTVHNESLLRTQTTKTHRNHKTTTLQQQEDDLMWREPFDLFGSTELRAVKPLLDSYLNSIRRLRYSLLSANRTWTPVNDDWELLNGYSTDYFTRVSMCPQIHTVFLVADFDVVHQVLPVSKFYDYGGTGLEDCSIMTDKWRAIYHNGDELLNKTCQQNLRDTLAPQPVDRIMLSLGLPFRLSPTQMTPTGHSPDKVILTFLNIVQNGVITAHGEVLSGNIGIMTQRCSHSWYRPELPADSESLPLYDEVLTITQQTMVWYYHNTIEDLPRVAPYLQLLRDNPHIKVHITRAEFHETMLAYLGVDSERLVSGPVRGRVVYLPAGTTCGRPPVFNTQLLAALFRQRVADQNVPTVTATPTSVNTNNNNITTSTKNTIIVIKRSSPDRQFRYHNAIVSMLQQEATPRGLHVHVFSDDPVPPMVDYIRLFSQAQLIVAPHGAGLSNLLFAPPDTVVLEGLCEMEPRFWFCFHGFLPWLCHSWYSRVSLSFRNLATILGQHYVGVNVPKGCLHVQPSDLKKQVQFYLDHLR